jgi:hypothetical protein
VGISTVFKILEHLWFKGDVTIPYGHDQHTIKFSLTQETIHVGISTVFKIFGHFLVKGG